MDHQPAQVLSDGGGCSEGVGVGAVVEAALRLQWRRERAVHILVM